MSFGESKKGGFNPASKAYKANPSLENYLHLRRANPSDEIEISVLGGFDSVMAMASEYEAYGLSTSQMMQILDANQEAISSIALRLIEELVHYDKLHQEGETQIGRRNKAMPFKLIDWIISISLEALSWNDSMEMNRDLIVLINARLSGKDPHYKQYIHARETLQKAIWIGAQLVARGQPASMRKAASILNVSPSTISRGFDKGEFEQKCKKLSSLFNADGTFKNPILSEETDPNK